MGLLDQVVGNMGGVRRPQAKPGLGQTVAAGVLLALLVKAARQQRAGSAAAQAQAQPGQAQGQGGGMLGGLGSLMGGGGLGNILGSLGGAGALGGMLGRLQQGGLADQVNSWVGTGENKRVEPHQLEAALGDDTLEELQRQTGLSRSQLLAQLTEELPEAVSATTPEGRVPDDQALQQIAEAPAKH